MNNLIESFGRYPKVNHNNFENLLWISDNPNFDDKRNTFLPYGLGKSYGDSCLNPENNLIGTRFLNRLIKFDPVNGILEAESGVTLEQCINFLMPRGWFLPVTPGTKLITLGGAIANDVHGKNHHKSGTIGNHIISFELLRSDYSRTLCSLKENPELFAATIGGLGLTGLITKIEIQCIKCDGPLIDCENIKFRSFEQFFEINEESKAFEYTVAWIDTNSDGSGIYTRGNFSVKEHQISYDDFKHSATPFPFELDLINPVSVYIFNSLFYAKQLEDKEKKQVHFNPFFYPLDAVFGWNKVYGKKGFLQYQFVIPHEAGLLGLKEIYHRLKASGNSSFLTVLKTFGDIKSPGILSFPKPGITMAIDFKITNNQIFKTLDKVDEVVKHFGGILYPAKDARMSGDNFRKFYPQWDVFSKYIDPQFSSGFWKRVTG